MFSEIECTQYAADVLQELQLSSAWVSIDKWRNRIMHGLDCTINQADKYIVALKNYVEVDREARSYRSKNIVKLKVNLEIAA